MVTKKHRVSWLAIDVMLHVKTFSYHGDFSDVNIILILIFSTLLGHLKMVTNL